VDKAREYKQEGNEYFKEKNFRKARTKWSRVFAYTKAILGTSPGAGTEISNGMADMALKMVNKAKPGEDLIFTARNLERDTSSNMALTYLKDGEWKKALEKATYVRYKISLISSR